MEKVIGYLRVSSTDQQRSGLGIDAQRERIQAEADRRGWDVEWVEDSGRSAKTMKRPGLERAFSMLTTGEAMGIVTASLDRLSRSTVDFGRTLQRAQHEGWSVVCLDINLDMTTATGRMVANVVAAIAQWESERIGERTSAALRAAETRGVKLGRPRSVSNELRARVVAQRASGATLQAIADALNAEQIPTARGGMQWHRGTIDALLKSA